MKPGVSVIICCYNSASRLPETLGHLAAQQLPEAFSWEIILVDNASSDTTKETALNLWSKKARPEDKERLRVVDQPVKGLSHARAKGVEVSRYNVVLFCDDDNWLSDNYVIDSFRIMSSDPKIGALGGSGSAVSDVVLPPWFEKYKGCYACYPQASNDGELKGASAFLYGAGLVVRRECFDILSSKDFSPILADRTGTKLTSGGDTELSYAIRLIGFKLWFSDKLKFNHFLPAGRLTDEYLYRLISSMSYCSGVLITYNYAIEGKSANFSVWAKDSFYQMTFFLKALGKFIVGKRSFDSRLNFAFSYNRMRSIFGQLTTYRGRYSQIMKLKS
jgi:glycosyltransferase involved in cell wall biosynthesis